MENIPCFIINLDTKPDFYRKTKNQLIGFNNVNRFNAINGSKIDNKQLSKLVSPFVYYNIVNESGRHETSLLFNRAGLGCYLSHVEIWKIIVENNIQSALILEDDVELSDKFLKSSDNFIKSVDADIYLLGYNRLFNETAYKNYLNVNDIFWGTQCYVITNDGAKKLLENALPAELQIDSYIGICSKRNLIKIVAPLKSLAHQRLHFSSIQEYNFKMLLPTENVWYILLILVLIFLMVRCRMICV